MNDSDMVNSMETEATLGGMLERWNGVVDACILSPEREVMTIEQIEAIILSTVKAKLEPVIWNGHEVSQVVPDLTSVHLAARRILEGVQG